MLSLMELLSNTKLTISIGKESCILIEGDNETLEDLYMILERIEHRKYLEDDVEVNIVECNCGSINKSTRHIYKCVNCGKEI